ncbi:hypothetical protein [Heliorestis convoluta]|uniref:Uncharacterized protein n=1 Tax=Heliorestis convoluta TaxID=356322 RepID=A0A5Q2N446_9FIRM|nr:hypothetical protein [Heliorestis convoluta]QGG48659.1 hypothetical protein FTV88_2566 [Heliorestis convoluta]
MAGFLSRLFGKKEEAPVESVASQGEKKPGAGALEAVKAQEERWKITSLTNADPYYELGKVAIIHSNRDFYVDFPAELKPFMLQKNKNFAFHEDKSFDGFHYYSDIPMRTGIFELVQLLNKHRMIAAKEWLDESRGTFENETKWGVLHINPYGKTGRSGLEENALEVQVYKTDAFTQRVFLSIYKELKNSNHEICKATLNEINRYNCFLTAFRVYALLLVQNGQEKELILSKDGKAWAQALTEEALEDRKFGLHKWFAYSLSAEHVHNNEILSKLENGCKYYDLFVDKEDLSIGFTAAATVDGTFAAACKGGDVRVPFTAQGISSLMSRGIDRTAAYQIRLLAARHGIDVS